MLSRFANEVLSHGPNAVLPQNLNAFWLKAIQKLCDDFLDKNFIVDQCTHPLDTGDPVLVACAHEVLGYNGAKTAKMTADELAEHVTIYALSVTMETIRRESDIEMDLPTMDNLLSIERIVRFGKINPEFGRFLERACIISDNEPVDEDNWFQRLRKKILSHFSGS